MSDEQDPVRLADASSGGTAGEGAPPESLQLALRSASAFGPSPADLQAVAAGIGLTLGPPGAGGSGSPAPGGGAPAAPPAPAAPVAASPAGASGFVKIAGAIVAAGAVVVIALVARHPGDPADRGAADARSGAAPTVSESPPAPSARVDRAGVADTGVTPTGASSAPASTASAARTSGDAPKPSAVAPPPATSAPASSEIDILSRARKALDSDPAKALALTEEHRREYPKGSLSQEREVIAIEALHRLGRDGDANRESDRFHTQYPTSIHQQNVETPPH